MHIDKKLAQELWQHRDKWVALSDTGKVLAHGKDLKDVHAKVTKEGATDYAFRLIPSKPVMMGA